MNAALPDDLEVARWHAAQAIDWIAPTGFILDARAARVHASIAAHFGFLARPDLRMVAPEGDE